MAALKPIKRCKELAPLSRDHHDGLLLVFKIRAGVRKGVNNGCIGNYIIYFFNTYLEAHFQLEEAYIFPLLPAGDKDRETAQAQHEQLRDLIPAIESPLAASVLLSEQFAQLLETHIRFEERVLFNKIQDLNSEDQLAATHEKIAHLDSCKVAWKDEFWT